MLDHELRFAGSPGGSISAPNRLHDLRTTVDGEAINVEPRLGLADWSVTLRLVGLGRDGDLSPTDGLRARVSPADPHRAERVGGDLVEWVVNERRGVEHGLTIGSRRGSADDGALIVAYELGGTLVASLDERRLSATFHDEGGAIRLRYDDLAVFDADGGRVPARFELDRQRLSIEIDDRRARYPLKIDPVFNSPDWSGEGDQLSAEFGIAVARGLSVGLTYVIYRLSGTENELSHQDGTSFREFQFCTGHPNIRPSRFNRASTSRRPIGFP